MEEVVYQLTNVLKDKHWWFLGRSRVITSVLNAYFKKNNLKILDAGCGASTSLPILVSLGFLLICLAVKK